MYTDAMTAAVENIAKYDAFGRHQLQAEEYDGSGHLAVDESEYVETCEIVLEECENPNRES